MKWKAVEVSTKGICVEAIAGLFHRLGSGGVEIDDPQAARMYVNKEASEVQSLSPDFLNHEFVVVKGYFFEGRDILDAVRAGVEDIEKLFQVPCRIHIGQVQDQDWEDSWKKYYHTFRVGDRLVIKPSWEEYPPQTGQVVVEIDPGMAFGTGIHASTRFCLRFIDEYVKGGEVIIDAGCGSGILSIAAAKLGAARITARDVDDVAVTIARENVILNGLQDRIEVASGDIIDEIQHLKADMILANITADVVKQLIPLAFPILTPGGYFFGSGIVDSRWPGVKEKLLSTGFAIEEVLFDMDWVGVVARKA